MVVLKPKIIPATLKDYPTIQNMARFYVYDLSRDCGFISGEWELPANGLYESFDFKSYFQDDTKKAFLIKVEKELAGFALIDQCKINPKTNWNIGEFFILAKFQGKGIGKEIAHQLWQKHPGLWEVAVIPENKSGARFWKKTINDFTAGDYSRRIKNVQYDKHQPKRIIFSFDSRS